MRKNKRRIAIKKYLEKNPDATFREIQQECNISSLSLVHYYMKDIVRRKSYDELSQRIDKIEEKLHELEKSVDKNSDYVGLNIPLTGVSG